ncbi:arsenate reductase (glutaredoxin) [Parasedimentitalea psychrophila]|uniref:Arsenate reductase n=1 Tax=Parasedimentitalea psychrophila TaxID=2997337 RepID=A0A9Y2P173_9RHOB|nr:arsenate reductase (glutaredoxin) [Parasedimentitalea psychrophila]WIY25321.1 arsenate reductase (glutaredoxin) [Parasedimentitalea psychrophila]
MITYWHNPRCSKSRAGLALLQDKGVEVRQRLYLSDPPSLGEIKRVQALLGGGAVDMMRAKDPLFTELRLSRDTPEAELQAAMATHTALIERPIAIAGDRAVIGRPTEAIETLL